MRRRDHKVVLTYQTMGLWTPIGYSVPEFEKNLFAGKCGITELTRFREKKLKINFIMTSDLQRLKIC